MLSDVVYPKEYFEAQVAFAVKVSQLTGKNIVDVYIYYTDLYASTTGVEWRDNPDLQIWKEVIGRVKGKYDVIEITNIFYETYLSLPHSTYNPEIVPKGMLNFGPLVVDYTPYSRERERISIHYLPRREEVSWLSSNKFQELQKEFRKLLVYAKDQYDMKYVFCSSWIFNIPNFKKLFPEQFIARLKDIGMSTYLGVWQEFLRADGNGNTERLQEFLMNLEKATTIDEAIRAIPLKVFEGIGTVEEFYDMYDIPYTKEVLFVCSGNVGRSQMAQGYYNSLTKGNNAMSAGIDDVGYKYDYHPTEKVSQVMQEEGIDISRQIVKPIREEMLQHANKIIVMCDKGESPNFLQHSPKAHFYSIPDPFGHDIDATREVRNMIKQMVEKLIKETNTT